MKRFLLAAALVFNGPALAHHTDREVTATVYHPEYHGEVAYCGSVYRHWGLSAAHPWLPCGTKVRVSHRGRSVVVPITDRCDCGSIDLSAGAAHRLGVPLDGTATVRISY
jgi:rare lipoprotein A